MKVRVLSFDKVGELVGFQFVMLPGGMGLDQRGQLVQGPPQPVAMIMVAFKDQFGIGPVGDMVPVWDDDAEVDELPKSEPSEPTEEELAKFEGLIEKATNDPTHVAEAAVVREPESDEPKMIVNTAESAGV